MSEPPVFKRAVIATMACVAIVGGCALYAHWQLYLPPECRGDIPKLVPFQEGGIIMPFAAVEENRMPQWMPRPAPYSVKAGPEAAE